MKNTTPETIELIYEMTRSVYMEGYKKEKSITDILYQLGGVEYVNIVVQSDEISG